jgi:hypothetical protein
MGSYNRSLFVVIESKHTELFRHRKKEHRMLDMEDGLD